MLDFLKKLTQKREQNKSYAQSQSWRSNALLQECLTALRGYCTVAIPDQREAVEAVVNSALKEGAWTQVESVPEDWLTGQAFILWNEMTLPVLHCDSALALANLDDVTAVAFVTFLVSESLDKIIHFGPHGRIRLYSNSPQVVPQG